MRQSQQNRRGRGRNNNSGGGGGGNNNQHRKGQNPLTRSFESNGPDMKIRGTPAHIAEKYIQLARDAHSAGDPVLAENYLQHAEHYNRIILAYREQQISQGGGDVARPRPAQLHEPMDGDDAMEDEGPLDPAEAPQPQVRMESGQPQPQRVYDNQQQRYNDQPRDARDDRNRDDRNRDDRNRDNRDRDNRDRDNRDRQQRFGQDGQPMRRPHRERFERNDRGERGDRFQGNRFQGDRFADRGGENRGPEGRGEPRGDARNQEARTPDAPSERPSYDRPQHERGPDRAAERAPAVERNDAPAPAVESTEAAPRSEAPRRRERFAQSAHEQPEFLRRPVRRPRREAPAGDEAGDSAPPAPVAVDDSGRE